MIGEGCEFIGGTLEVDCQGFSIMSKNNDLLNRPGSRDAIASKKGVRVHKRCQGMERNQGMGKVSGY